MTIAEDDPAIQQILHEVLADEGYRTVLAGEGAAAIDAAKAQLPTQLLMDLQLPVLDRAAAVRRLKRDPATAGIWIIAMSAEIRLLHLDPERLPADGVLPKPVDLEAVEADAPGVAYQGMAAFRALPCGAVREDAR